LYLRFGCNAMTVPGASNSTHSFPYRTV
jgi:hypothetical protein